MIDEDLKAMAGGDPSGQLRHHPESATANDGRDTTPHGWLGFNSPSKVDHSIQPLTCPLELVRIPDRHTR
jgi:hypothetical protein